MFFFSKIKCTHKHLSIKKSNDNIILKKCMYLTICEKKNNSKWILLIVRQKNHIYNSNKTKGSLLKRQTITYVVINYSLLFPAMNYR